jgi:DNA polymerase III subunit beta
MKITLNSKELNKRLQFLGGIIGTNNTLPILDNFLFEIDNKELKITASDLETTISTAIVIDADFKKAIAVPAKLLIEILKTFAEQPLVFTIKENNTIEISSDTGVYEIAYLPADEYPKAGVLEKPTSTFIPAKVLATGISKTIIAVGSDELRPVMCGILFQLSPTGLNIAATDAHKLVKYSRTDVESVDKVDFIVPKKPLGILKNVLSGVDLVKIDYNQTNVTFDIIDYTIAIRLIDGKYPNYEGVIPKENPNKLIIDRYSFLQSVKRVNTFSNKTTHQIKLKLAGMELNISAEDVDYSNKADERLTCNYEGEDMEIGFNSKYLIEMLGNLDSKDIQLEMSTPTRAGILTQIDGLEPRETIINLVMPVQINKN